MTTRHWFGPPLNRPAHLLHGAVPVLRNGRHIGWVLSTGSWFTGLLFGVQV